MRNILTTALTFVFLTSCASAPTQAQSVTPTSLSTTNNAHTATIAPSELVIQIKDMQPIPVNDKLWIDSIAIENTQSLWLIGIGETTDQKYSLINYDTKDWHVFEIPTNMVSCYANAPLNVADLVVEPDGTVWGNSGCKIFRFDGNTWKDYSSDDGIGQGNISALVLDPLGNIWVGTDKGFVSKFDKTQWTTYSKEDSTNLEAIYSSIVLSDGTLWFGGLGGISHFDGEHWVTYKHEAQKNKPILAVEIAATKNGEIWVVENAGKGAMYYFDGKSWQDVNEIESRCTSVFVDQNNHVWLGAIDRLFYSTGKDWLEIPISTVTGMAQTQDGAIWFGTHGGLYLYNSGNR
jgi:ligand-binding sensor domain-containing protein